jgi:uncharacterized protein YdeI (YjbR/CyaY-like superfamily)
MNKEQSISADVRAGLMKTKGALEALLALSASHKKEYLKWIGSAKKTETRERRIRKTAEMLLKKSA